MQKWLILVAVVCVLCGCGKREPIVAEETLATPTPLVTKVPTHFRIGEKEVKITLGQEDTIVFSEDVSGCVSYDGTQSILESFRRNGCISGKYAIFSVNGANGFIFHSEPSFLDDSLTVRDDFSLAEGYTLFWQDDSEFLLYSLTENSTLTGYSIVNCTSGLTYVFYAESEDLDLEPVVSSIISICRIK